MSAFATPQPITAKITTAGALVRVTASDRQETVVLVEPLDPANDSDVQVAGKTEVGFAAGELTISTKKPGAKDGSVAITVELPAGSGLVLNTAWSQVRADGPLGACELDVASGRIELDRVAALRARFAAGAVAVGHLAGTAEIQGAPDEVRIGEADGVVRYEGATGKVRIGRILRGQAELVSHSGDIEIGIGEDTGAWVDAESKKGTVRNSLPPQENPGEFDDKVKIRVRTRHGDVVIHRAATTGSN